MLVRRKVRQRFGGRLKALGLRRRAAQLRGRRLLPGARRAAAAGLRPDRGLARDQRQPAEADQDRHGRPAARTASRCSIAEDGEILVRGELVMKGYWNDPEATARGDPRRLAAHRRHRRVRRATAISKITDRKKDIIVLSGGDNVSPARVEGFLMLQPEIAQAMVLRRQAIRIWWPWSCRMRTSCADWAKRATASPNDLAALVREPRFHQGDRRGGRPGQLRCRPLENASAASR